MQTSKWICINKDYDSNGKYSNCLLENSTTGEQKWVDKNQLKRDIKTRRLVVLNLQVTSANRLIEVSGINTDMSKRAQDILDTAVSKIVKKAKEKYKSVYVRAKRNKLDANNSVIASSQISVRNGTECYVVSLNVLKNGKYVVKDSNNKEVYLSYIKEVVEEVSNRVYYFIDRTNLMKGV